MNFFKLKLKGETSNDDDLLRSDSQKNVIILINTYYQFWYMFMISLLILNLPPPYGRDQTHSRIWHSEYIYNSTNLWEGLLYWLLSVRVVRQTITIASRRHYIFFLVKKTLYFKTFIFWIFDLYLNNLSKMWFLINHNAIVYHNDII